MTANVVVTEGGIAPTRGSEKAVGYDLYAAEDVLIPGIDSIQKLLYPLPKFDDETVITNLLFNHILPPSPSFGCTKVPCNIAFTPPPGCFGMIKGRSGLTTKHHLDVGAGIIDPDYTGNIQVAFFNHGYNDYQIKKGDRIAQLIFLRYATPEIVVVESLVDTERGNAGFGSTG